METLTAITGIVPVEATLPEISPFFTMPVLIDSIDSMPVLIDSLGGGEITEPIRTLIERISELTEVVTPGRRFERKSPFDTVFSLSQGVQAHALIA